VSFGEGTRIIDEALVEVVPKAQRSIVIGDAIRNAGTLNIPPDPDGIMAFVNGPLLRAARAHLDSETAAQLVAAVEKRLPTPTKHDQTLPYGEEAGDKLRADLAARVAALGDVDGGGTLPYGAGLPGQPGKSRAANVEPLALALVEPDSGYRVSLCEMLQARGHTVHTAKGVSEVVEIATVYAIQAVISNLEPGGYSFASSLRIELGRAMPPVILLGGSLTLHAPRPGVTLSLPRTLDVSVAEAIERVVTEES
jgi:hypothetical protein